MNFGMIKYLFAIVLRFEAAFMGLSLVVSLLYAEFQTALVFGIVIAAMAIISLALGKKPANRSFYAKEGVIAVSLSWLIISVFGALPFFLTGAIPSFVDALFETVSGFTTTGASILTDVELEPDPMIEPGTLCIRCGKCVSECPGNAVPPIKEENAIHINVGGKDISWGDVKMGRCTLTHHGQNNRISPFHKEAFPNMAFDVENSDMTEEEAKDLAIRAVRSAMRRDAGSGENIMVVVIMKDKYEESIVSGLQTTSTARQTT